LISAQKKRAVSQRAFILFMVSYTYGDATYNAELQVRHQKLLTMFVLISVCKYGE
jgi:hypothetical protein